VDSRCTSPNCSSFCSASSISFFLCSPEAEMIRGQTLIVDGGFSLVV
jgi:NAD(P)-dependent dehydrogenase (short-subunit alcohol dehydrogenase family)